MMQIERERPSTYKITLHTYELTALISAARWVVDGAKGDLPKEAKDQLSQILTAYDTEVKKMSKAE